MLERQAMDAIHIQNHILTNSQIVYPRTPNSFSLLHFLEVKKVGIIKESPKTIKTKIIF